MSRRLDSVVFWKWRPARGYRSEYLPPTVNTAAAMVRRHYRPDVRVICVTDDAAGIDSSVDVVPLWNDFSNIPSPHGAKNPSCYRRLRMFHPDIASLFGQRFLSLDLDTVIVGDVKPIWERPEDFVAWGDTNTMPGSHYNGSMILHTAGTRPQLWNDFDPHVSPGMAKQAGCFGSDQGWISYRLGPGEAKWSTADGVFSYRNHIKPNGGRLPDAARIVSFHGNADPWGIEAQGLDWVRKHYTMPKVAA